jgi:hypothetical protein
MCEARLPPAEIPLSMAADFSSDFDKPGCQGATNFAFLTPQIEQDA